MTFAIRTARFRQLAGFDECFIGDGAEDTDFGFRAHQAGIDLLLLGGTGAFHQHHQVYDPPLQHFDDIIRNAEIFYAIWGLWPMQRWLGAFEGLGLIRWDETKLTLIRPPTASEIQMAAQHNIQFGP